MLDDDFKNKFVMFNANKINGYKSYVIVEVFLRPVVG